MHEPPPDESCEGGAQDVNEVGLMQVVHSGELVDAAVQALRVRYVECLRLGSLQAGSEPLELAGWGRDRGCLATPCLTASREGGVPRRETSCTVVDRGVRVRGGGKDVL